MKKIFATVLLLSCSAMSLASNQKFELDAAHSHFGFEVSHFGISKVPGKFNDFKGSFEFNEQSMTLSNLRVEVKTASVDTGNKDRDAHLVGSDFFNSSNKKHETAILVIRRPVKLTGAPVMGELTLRGVKKNIPLNITFNGSAEAMGMKKAAFEATGIIDRSAFGMTWNKPMDEAGKDLASTSDKVAAKAKNWLVGNEVNLVIRAQANQSLNEKDNKAKKRASL